jgi:hypothetical protein
MNEPPRFTVEPVTQLAMFQPGLRFLVPVPRRRWWGFHRSLEETRLAGEQLRNPPAGSS